MRAIVPVFAYSRRPGGWNDAGSCRSKAWPLAHSFGRISDHSRQFHGTIGTGL